MEVKSWKELNKRKTPRRMKKKILEDNQNIQNVSFEKAVEDFFKEDENVEEDKVQENIIENKPTTQPTKSENKKEIVWQEWQDNKSDENKNMATIKKRSKNKYNKSKKSSTKKLKLTRWFIILLILLAGLTITVGALRFFVNDSGDKDVELTISGPDEVAVGEEAVWTISYNNLSEVDLKRLELTMKYPAGFKLVSAEPIAINDYQNVWDLGNLSTNKSGEVKIRGQLFGEEGETKEFSASLLYQPANFSSDFVKEVSKSVNLGVSRIKIDIEQPESIIPETDYSWKFSVTNLTEQRMENLSVTFVTLPGFVMSDPSPEEVEIVNQDKTKSYIWKGENIWSGKAKNYIFDGSFPASARGINELKVIVSIDENGTQKVLQEYAWNSVILGEEVTLGFTVNKEDSLAEVNPGGILDYQVTIKNTSGQDLKDLEVGLKLTNDYVEWSALKAPAEPSISDTGLVSLTKENFEELAELKAGGELILDYEVVVKEKILGSGTKLKAFATVKVGAVGEKSKDDLDFSTRVITTEIKPQVKFRASAIYYDDEGLPVGTGPIPPQVDKQTIYQINWTVKTNVTNYSDSKITAQLPQSSTWEGVVATDQGSINYNSTNKTVTWNLGDIKTSDGEQQAFFKVSITPDSGDLSKVVNLLNMSTMNAKDSDNNTIVVTTSLLNTNLAGALFGSGQGTVQPYQ